MPVQGGDMMAESVDLLHYVTKFHPIEFRQQTNVTYLRGKRPGKCGGNLARQSGRTNIRCPSVISSYLLR